MKAGAELLAKKLPVWDEAKGSIDMYYWYYGTLAMHQMGGDDWERWNKNLKTAVIDTQHARTAASREAGIPRIPGATKAAASTRPRS